MTGKKMGIRISSTLAADMQEGRFVFLLPCLNGLYISVRSDKRDLRDLDR